MQQQQQQQQPYPTDQVVHRETLGCISEHVALESSRPHHPALPKYSHPPMDHVHPQHRSNSPHRPDFHTVIAQLNDKFRIVSEDVVEPPGYQSDHETYVQPPKTLPPAYHDGYSSDWDSVTTLRRHPTPLRAIPLDVAATNGGVPTRLPRHLHPMRDPRVAPSQHDGRRSKVAADVPYSFAVSSPSKSESPRGEQVRLLSQYRANLRTSRDGYSLPLDRSQDQVTDSCP